MTTSKPEVVAWTWVYCGRGVTQNHDFALGLPVEVEPLIRLSDYEELQAEVDQLRKDAARLDWMENQARLSPTGISFDYVNHVEDGRVLNRGYRFMRRHFISGDKDTLRRTIDAVMVGDET